MRPMWEMRRCHSMQTSEPRTYDLLSRTRAKYDHLYFQKFIMTKKVCFVCCEGEGCFRFPKDTKRLKEWMESLSIRDIPPDNARICADVTGRRSISHLALPLKESHPKSIDIFCLSHISIKNHFDF